MSRISFSNINSWQDFKSYAESLPNTKQMGDAFEHLTYLYFKLDPKYSFYDEVYKMSEVPSSDLEKLKIPRQDLGIDLIAKVGEEYHPIQCKYHTDKLKNKSLDKNQFPYHPDRIYKNNGWTSMDDFLSKRRYKDFESIKTYAKKLKIKSGDQWREHFLIHKVPEDIPKTVQKVFKQEWKGWADFLGKD